MTGVIDIINFTLFRKNRNIFTVECYYNFFSTLKIFVFYCVSYAAGYFLLSGDRSPAALAVGFVSIIIFMAGFIIFETSIYYPIASLLGGKCKTGNFLKSIILSYSPLIFFAPAAILSLKISGLFTTLIFIWIVILKFKFFRINTNFSGARTLLLLLFPLIIALGMLIAVISLAVLIGLVAGLAMI